MEKFFDVIKYEKSCCRALQKGSAAIIESVKQGVWRMPWLLEAKKDVVSCDKPWVFANEN